MPPKYKRKKQSGPRSGFGCLRYLGPRNQWVVQGHETGPDGKVKRPILHRFHRDDTPTRAEAERCFALWVDRQKREAAIYRRGAVYDIRALCNAFLDRAKAIYARGDKTASHWGFDAATAKQWALMQGSLRLSEYDGEHFRAFRDALDKAASKGGGDKVKIRTREGVNKKLKSARRIVKWAVSAGLCEPRIGEILAAVEPLKEGNAKTKDGAGRNACSVDQFEGCLAYLPDRWMPVAILQRWGGGARPSEVLSLRADELSYQEGLWIARKAEHKTKAKGFAREIVFSPPAASWIESLLEECTPDDPYLFSYRRWFAKWPGAFRRPLSALGLHPTEETYRDEISAACAIAEVERFTPYQICHLRLTEIAAALSKEHARATRGHASSTMTAEYVKDSDAKKNRRLAIEAAGVGVE